MLKLQLVNLMGNTTALTTIRFALVLSVLIISLLVTGVAFAGPTPGGVGS